jgi:hypothetical protein
MASSRVDRALRAQRPHRAPRTLPLFSFALLRPASQCGITQYLASFLRWYAFPARFAALRSPRLASPLPSSNEALQRGFSISGPCRAPPALRHARNRSKKRFAPPEPLYARTCSCIIETEPSEAGAAIQRDSRVQRYAVPERPAHMVTGKARKSLIKARRPTDRAIECIEPRSFGGTRTGRVPPLGDGHQLSALVQCLYRYVDANPSRFQFREERIGSRRVLTLVLAANPNRA